MNNRSPLNSSQMAKMNKRLANLMDPSVLRKMRAPFSGGKAGELEKDGFRVKEKENNYNLP